MNSLSGLLVSHFLLFLSVKNNKAVWTEEELQVVKHRLIFLTKNCLKPDCPLKKHFGFFREFCVVLVTRTHSLYFFGNLHIMRNSEPDLHLCVLCGPRRIGDRGLTFISCAGFSFQVKRCDYILTLKLRNVFFHHRNLQLSCN